MIDSVTAIQNSGYYHKRIRTSLESEKVALEAEQARLQKRIEEQLKRVEPIYDAEGKVIEYDNSGRHLNTSA